MSILTRTQSTHGACEHHAMVPMLHKEYNKEKNNNIETNKMTTHNIHQADEQQAMVSILQNEKKENI